MLILNFKTYSESSGAGIYKLADIVSSCLQSFPQMKNKVFIAPQALYLLDIKRKFPHLNIMAQHLDPLAQGKNTGWFPADAAKNEGINITLLNHSEHRLNGSLEYALNFLKERDIRAVVCCENVDEANEIVKLNPYAIAFEPKSLIGTGKSVSTENVEDVSQFVGVLNSTEVISVIGAGVSTGADIAAGYDLGAKGFLLASDFVKAEDPGKELSEMLKIMVERTINNSN